MYIVCVTSCPAGIAHTYMAAANLEKAAKKMGIDIKVEKQGIAGIEDELSEEEIARADGVIIAADISIAQKERFEGKTIIECGVSEAIKNPEGVINKLIEEVKKNV
ncbi:MAG: PTS system, fructose-specific, IIB subunnit [Caldanaerobacter subterraneus]|uniref:PTS fructose transporter subunit IIB n=1 Tax=Caldanaerobacter subterraneus TaxID=911092 RepID=A0A101E4Y0_9THEO|nr:PTS fructose transporter subunit IIB [Caldanaerobacter subterraneus]KUK08656.1 MAG: PTS system, fructose-specific, IIB subunnit [Caldanaerobacter subterraneus]MDK2793808.1 fructose system component [Caldanaerobacter sp.]TCO67629.1 PTS system fructose-specific IIB component [Caldanaerobacter subterraneus]HBT49969.1 PTS fructose transporter subunit IIB [Caldanaerobacter subterraneus]